MIYLKKANPEDLEKEWQFVRDMPEDENGLTNEWNGVTREDFESRALPAMLDYMKGKNLPEGYVPETFFFLWNPCGPAPVISVISSRNRSGEKVTEPKASA